MNGKCPACGKSKTLIKHHILYPKSQWEVEIILRICRKCELELHSLLIINKRKHYLIYFSKLIKFLIDKMTNRNEDITYLNEVVSNILIDMRTHCNLSDPPK